MHPASVRLANAQAAKLEADATSIRLQNEEYQRAIEAAARRAVESATATNGLQSSSGGVATSAVPQRPTRVIDMVAERLVDFAMAVSRIRCRVQDAALNVVGGGSESSAVPVGSGSDRPSNSIANLSGNASTLAYQIEMLEKEVEALIGGL